MARKTTRDGRTVYVPDNNPDKFFYTRSKAERYEGVHGGVAAPPKSKPPKATKTKAPGRIDAEKAVQGYGGFALVQLAKGSQRIELASWSDDDYHGTGVYQYKTGAAPGKFKELVDPMDTDRSDVFRHFLGLSRDGWKLNYIRSEDLDWDQGTAKTQAASKAVKKAFKTAPKKATKTKAPGGRKKPWPYSLGPEFEAIDLALGGGAGSSPTFADYYLAGSAAGGEEHVRIELAPGGWVVAATVEHPDGDDVVFFKREGIESDTAALRIAKIAARTLPQVLERLRYKAEERGYGYAIVNGGLVTPERLAERAAEYGWVVDTPSGSITDHGFHLGTLLPMLHLGEGRTKRVDVLTAKPGFGLGSFNMAGTAIALESSPDVIVLASPDGELEPGYVYSALRTKGGLKSYEPLGPSGQRIFKGALAFQMAALADADLRD